MKIIEQLKRKYLKAYEEIDHGNATAAINTLKAMQKTILDTKKLSVSEKESVWVWVEKVFSFCHVHLQDQQSDVQDMLQTYKLWQENCLLPSSSSLLPIHEALLQIAAAFKGTPEQFERLVNSQVLFTTDANDALQNTLTQLVLQKRYQTALRYGAVLLERYPSANGYVALGQVALSYSSNNRAMQLFQQALSHDAACPEAHGFLGQLNAESNPLDAVSSYQNAIDGFYQQAHSDEDAVRACQKMFLVLCDLMTLSPHLQPADIDWALDKAKKVLVLAEEKPNLRSLAHGMYGLLYGCKQHVFDATFHFSKSAHSNSTQHIENMRHIHQALANLPDLQARVYQFAVEGLHDEWRKRQDCSVGSVWQMAKNNDGLGDHFQAGIMREIAFRFASRFADVRLDDKSLFVKAYLRWIQTTFLQRADYFHAMMYWYRLLENEPVDTLPLDDIFLSQLKEAYSQRWSIWPEFLAIKHEQIKALLVKPNAPIQALKPAVLQTPVIVPIVEKTCEKEADSVRILREIKGWLEAITLAIQSKKTLAKKTELKTQELLLVEQYVLQRFQEYGPRSKHYPNVLEAIEVLLKGLSYQECEPLYFQLAKLYQPVAEQAKRLYTFILRQNPTAFEAHIELAEIAYIQQQLSLAKRHIDSIPTEDPLAARVHGVSSKIAVKQTEWADKLAKIRLVRSNETPDFSKVKTTLQECEAFLRDKEGADIFAEALLEVGILQVLCEQKKSGVKPVNQTESWAIDVSGYEKAIVTLQSAASRMPDSFDAAYWLGRARRSAGKLFQVVVDNNWALKEEWLKARRELFESSVQRFYAQASANFTHARDLNHPNQLAATWELAQLQEIAGQYHDAVTSYTDVGNSPSPYSQRARVKIADLNIKVGLYRMALEQYQSIEADPKFDVHLCSRTKLYFNSGMAAHAAGLMDEARSSLERAKLSAETIPCCDVEGLRLLVGSAGTKDYYDGLQRFFADKPHLNGVCLVIRHGTKFYFHDNINGVIDKQAIDLGDISPLMSSGGINLEPDRMLLLHSGDNTHIYHAIQTKIGWQRPVVSWKNTMIATIQAVLDGMPQESRIQTEHHSELQTLLGTSNYSQRFSCAAPRVEAKEDNPENQSRCKL